ncbi:hypothetical protein [Tenacibaculum maritimum]
MEERIVLVSFFLLFIVKKKQVAPATRARSKQDKQPVRKFPNTDMVYHFHPIVFINYMKPKGFIVKTEWEEENLPVIDINNPSETYSSLR